MELDKAKILLLYASSGAGHKIACRAIEQQIRHQCFKGTIQSVDILKFMPAAIARIFSRGYLYAASKIPWLWHALYERRSSLSNFKPPPTWQKIFWKLALWRLHRYLKEEKPDYIISTYFTASWAAGRYKNISNQNCLVATVVTDYGLHPVWLAPCQDRYFVASQSNKCELEDFAWYTAVGADKIKAVGIPIEKRFTIAKSRSELQERYRFHGGRFTILVLAGTYGLRHLEMIVEKLLKCRSPLQVFLVASKQFQLSQKLKEALTARDIKYRLFGIIDFMEDLMAMSDVAITKTGGLTSTECLVSGLPLIIYRPYPGQEERNAAFFLESGAALRLFQLESLPLKIDMLASDKQKHQAMIKAAKSIARPNAAEEIAATVLSDLKRK